MRLKEGASAVIVSNNNILMRPKAKRFQLIGGMSHEKESPVDTIIREAIEEAGLYLKPEKLEIIRELKDNGHKHTFFLYRLTEAEITGDFARMIGIQKSVWLPIIQLKNKMFYWWGYWVAIRAARKRLYMNLLSFMPTI